MDLAAGNGKEERKRQNVGAINYKTSEYITLGLKPYSAFDLEKDAEFMEEMQAQAEEYGNTVEEEVYSYIDRCYECDVMNVEYEFDKYAFYYFHVTMEPGYYEGFTINIESNFDFDAWESKQEAQKEITQLKKMLIECAGLGLVSCYPGWCSGYDDYAGTIETIKAAVKEMREEVKHTPTWWQYERSAS